MGEARWPSTWRDCCVPLCYASSSPCWPKSQEDWIGSITLSKPKTMMTTLETRIMTTLAPVSPPVPRDTLLHLPISKKMKTIADPIRMKLVPTMLVTTILAPIMQGLQGIVVVGQLGVSGGTATYFFHIG